MPVPQLFAEVSKCQDVSSERLTRSQALGEELSLHRPTAFAVQARGRILHATPQTLRATSQIVRATSQIVRAMRKSPFSPRFWPKTADLTLFCVHPKSSCLEV